MTCPTCSAPLAGAPRYCPHCGERLFEKRRAPAWLYTFIIVALLAAFVSALFLPRPAPPLTPLQRFT